MEAEILLFVIKLSLGALMAFFAIMLWGKSGEASWMAMIAGIVVKYAGIVYDFLVNVGFVAVDRVIVFGIPLTTLFFSVIPPIFVSLALLLMIVKSVRN